ncbi:precorrin-4 C(11)-methyltransferase [Seleniivibrio woodruffii]|uniref:Cobalt-precorrin 4 C11-methyltransferase n=1 Tax=Seleniivibrio woodruffii TaxID=1078050 RepID=A0A4R1KDB7_9BACT|nr:precorrin-4 C(11)-methyltransferase [Seleniivibrio woodruffii]TCK62585.1 cobalt-precorrin 4 C11-methyltransferase [Seleniivibrio woodruffii]TVZ36989.1 cobalt-precorrin 4 C11-methyltransferase [Seleniivibrio woodruffii]
MKVYFIGAGPGDAELITVKGARLIGECPVVIYAGSLVNPDILKYASNDAEIYDSAPLNLDEIVEIIKKAHKENKNVARVHTGDPALYGATGEQIAELDKLGIEYETVPGVTSMAASAAAANIELTMPEISQTVIITRTPGRTPMPEELSAIAKVGGTIAFFLSAGQGQFIADTLTANGWSGETPVVLVYRASWADQKIARCLLKDLEKTLKENGMTKQTMILAGRAVGGTPETYSKLYDRAFSHEYR